MLVYRICKEPEMESLLNTKSFTNVGKNFKINSKMNNHNYKEEKKYLHFFKFKNDIFYLNLAKNYFLCTYDIPDDILKEKHGIGLYLDLFKFNNLIEVEEYAIETDLLKIEYLVKVERFLSVIDLFDYMEEQTFNTENISLDEKLELVLKP